MKRSIKIAVAAAIALSSTSAFATNGDQLIGLGAKSRAMGGTGIASYMGAESSLSNPALLTKTKGTDISFGGTVFMPNVEQKTTVSAGGVVMQQGSDKSDADMNVIPEIAIASEVSPGVVLGLGMFGSAGMGVDYRHGEKSPQGFNMSTTLQLMKMAPSVAVEVAPGLSVGVAAVLQYGSLDISYDQGMGNGMDGNGQSQDFGVGYELGAAYALKDTGLTFGAVYKSAIDMKYQDQIAAASSAFGIAMGEGFSDHLEQPAEYGFGVEYKMHDLTLTADYKKIKWGSAQGYQDFGWENQNVYAIGAAYGLGNLTLRAGYNYGKSPIKEQNAASRLTAGEYDGAVINQFNLLGFPAIVEKHYTVGMTYQMSKSTSVDLAYAYAPEVTEKFDTSAMTQQFMGNNALGSNIETKHSQQSVAMGVNFHF